MGEREGEWRLNRGREDKERQREVEQREEGG